MFDSLVDAGGVDAITDAGRAQNVACAGELAAIGELYARRAPGDDVERFSWAVDGHENVVAEMAAALRISRGRARGRLRHAIALRERLPRVAEVFGEAISISAVAAVVTRTELVDDGELMARIDAAVARHAPNWMRLWGPRPPSALTCGWPVLTRPGAAAWPAERGLLCRDRLHRSGTGGGMGAVARHRRGCP